MARRTGRRRHAAGHPGGRRGRRAARHQGPAHPQAGPATPFQARWALSVFAGRTDGASPWLRHAPASALTALDLPALAAGDPPGLAAGDPPGFGTPAPGPLFLVCTHGRRDVCCARYGGHSRAS